MMIDACFYHLCMVVPLRFSYCKVGIFFVFCFDSSRPGRPARRAFPLIGGRERARSNPPKILESWISREKRLARHHGGARCLVFTLPRM